MAVNNDWYARQFGERDQFAIAISFGRDLHPTGDPVIDAGWGALSLWVRGRCLTRNLSSEGGVSDAVQWSLTGIINWFIDAGSRLINEEPFPELSEEPFPETAISDHLRDACDWFSATETPLPSLAEPEEDDWFLRRSEWGQQHALRRSATDAALPNVMIRRLGDFLEISWDNETWATSRPDVRFVEQRGTTLVSASRAAASLHAALVDAALALWQQYKLPKLKEMATAASRASATDDDWRWLIHRRTARVINDELPLLRARLSEHARTKHCGLYVPHTDETLILRQAQLTSARDVDSLLEAAQITSKRPLKAPIRSLIRPTQPSTIKPWREGYERALEVRDALGWADEPLPDLGAWMKTNNLSVTLGALSPSIDLVATRTGDNRASVVLNRQARSHLRREIGHATALGHIILDMTPVAVDGNWEHWSTAARARAFAAMLALPDDGVRDVLAGKANPSAEDVKRVMDRFNTGPYATTYHLKNLGFIGSDEHRVEILKELAA